MLNSKDLLEKTGISRATLNNYISWGIVPKPQVLPPEPGGGAAPRIGFFPEETVARIGDIQRLKREGWSMTRIAEHFGAGLTHATATAEVPATPAAREAPRPAPVATVMPRLSLEEIAHPAYLVDQQFGLVWFNRAAGAEVLGGAAQPAAGTSPQSVLLHLLRGGTAGDLPREQILLFHLGVAKQRGASLEDVCRGASADEAALLRGLFGRALAPSAGPVAQVSLPPPAGAREPVSVYAVQFREGTLFIHAPGGAASSEELSALLAQRDMAAGQPSGKRPPALSKVAVLVTDLQQSSRIWSALPAEEYFELINDIWLTIDPIFRRHHGTHGKHAGDGMVGYFLPQRDSNYLWNALLAATELREAMRRLNKEWQLRKGWATELYMNTGIDEGQQWLGTLRSGGQLEFTALGEAFNRAARISDFSRGGAIWATKNLVARLSPEEKQLLNYGVSSESHGPDAFVPSIFSTPDRLIHPDRAASESLKDIARLPITEIVEIVPIEKPPGRPTGHNQI